MMDVRVSIGPGKFLLVTPGTAGKFSDIAMVGMLRGRQCQIRAPTRAADATQLRSTFDAII